MRKLTSILMIALLAIVGVGCDSNDDEGTSDTDLFIGTWNLAGFSDANGDRTASFVTSYEGLSIVNGADGSLSLNVDPVGADAFSIPGTYTVNEGAKTFVATLTIAPGQSTPLTFGYSFTNDNTAVLEGGAATSGLLAVVFQPDTPYAPPINITVARQ